ncbi:hypothetical protein N7519_001450 [Penicillium mononematosum]|uniref:uncharacterized protein n=1 Tax=Penicillium mononematosum TaxID=268346 RepID=UPI002546F190|nr:uncharacterized protein N7519_001450 [Penicillium mononematosum]KAJ6191429.1 hypothetical protein N7519_001450 [Penicillium mononematosum]
MAWPLYNIAFNDSSPSYEPGWDTSGFKWPQVSPTHPSSVSWGSESSMSPNHLLYNHYMQDLSAQLDPNFAMPEASYALDLSRLNQNVTHCFSLEGNVAAKPFPMDAVSPTTCAASPSSDGSVRETPRPKVNAGHCPSVDTPYRHHGAHKSSPG